MQIFIKGHVFFIGAAMLFLLLSILCRFMTGVLLRRLIKEAESMSATENKLLKQCKLKFQSCCELNEGVVNVGVFTEKFMQGIRFGRCSLHLIGQLSGQLLLLSVLTEGIGSCVGILYGETLGQVLPYYLLALFSLYLYFSISGIIDVPGQQEELKTTIMDFLENRMKGRLVNTKKDSEYLEEEENKARLDPGETLYTGAERMAVGTDRMIAGTEQMITGTEQMAAGTTRMTVGTEEFCTKEGQQRRNQDADTEMEDLLGEFLA